MIESAQVRDLERFSTPAILNGLKRLGIAPEALETIDRQAVQCMAPSLGARAGFAATRLIATRRSGGEAQPSDCGIDQGLLSVSAPRFLAVQNVGDWRGPVCIWGEVAANINLAFGCSAGVTNGPVRDVSEMVAAGFQAFAGGIGPGGGHVDLLEVGGAVTIGGVVIRPGDILHGDRHGIVRIPPALVAQLPKAIAEVERWERRIIDLCRSPSFTPEALTAAMGAK